jgi:hypothetical protein
MNQITKFIGAWLWVLGVFWISLGIRWIAGWGIPAFQDVMFTFVLLMAYLHFRREMERA